MYPNLINYEQLNKEIIEINFKRLSLKLNMCILIIIVLVMMTVYYFNKDNSKINNKKKYIKKLKYIQDKSEKILNR